MRMVSAETGGMAVAKRRKVGNLLALSLLSLLAQKPMYPYEMAQTLRARGKDQNFKVNWGSLYTVVRNLEKYGFIEAAVTDREGVSRSGPPTRSPATASPSSGTGSPSCSACPRM